MKRYLLLLSFCTALLSFTFSIASAQIILPFSQGQITAHDNTQFSNHVIWSIDIPNLTFTGTTTGAFLTFDTNGVAYDRNWQSVQITLTCGTQFVQYLSDDSTFFGHIITHTQPSLVALNSGGTSGFFNVQNQTCTVGIDYTFNPAHAIFNYYGQATSTHPSWTVTGSGSNGATAVGVPSFSFAVNNFYITPTASSTGLFLSGAKEFCDSAFGTSTSVLLISIPNIPNGICQAFGYLFVPTPQSINQFSDLNGLLQTKIPFSYAYGLFGIYSGLTASSTENMQSFAIDFPSFGSSTPLGDVIPTRVDILSTTTISKYYPSPIRSTFLFLGSCAIWIGALLVVYRRIVPTNAL